MKITMSINIIYKYINKKMIRFLYCTMERIFVNIKKLKRANNIAHSQKILKLSIYYHFVTFSIKLAVSNSYKIFLFIYLIFIQIITVYNNELNIFIKDTLTHNK